MQYMHTYNVFVQARTYIQTHTHNTHIIIACWFVTATKLHCQCILCHDVIQLLAVTGEVFTVPLLFPVRMNECLCGLVCDMNINVKITVVLSLENVLHAMMNNPLLPHCF